MSSEWVSVAQRTTPIREFETIAELWLPNKGTTSFSNIRKLQSSQQRKKNNDKRDSLAQLGNVADNSPKKLRGTTLTAKCGDDS
ncbi:hypothetical protein Clacol_003913 [Clathrus columnatus]|uniref:Uncharacterized protein n=1 Tax=Clathrus columnatus TaxID=1419009 RepID=A0AAV5A4Y9_9AGAM|nr:hypothetical protein Clacol_003913 [Clathrus columnatus]